jgi:hypothetical protein
MLAKMLVLAVLVTFCTALMTVKSSKAMKMGRCPDMIPTDGNGTAEYLHGDWYILADSGVKDDLTACDRVRISEIEGAGDPTATNFDSDSYKCSGKDRGQAVRSSVIGKLSDDGSGVIIVKMGENLVQVSLPFSFEDDMGGKYIMCYACMQKGDFHQVNAWFMSTEKFVTSEALMLAKQASVYYNFVENTWDMLDVTQSYSEASCMSAYC